MKEQFTAQVRDTTTSLEITIPLVICQIMKLKGKDFVTITIEKKEVTK